MYKYEEPKVSWEHMTEHEQLVHMLHHVHLSFSCTVFMVAFLCVKFIFFM